jgi:uncharacterized protein with HEPN domain
MSNHSPQVRKLLSDIYMSSKRVMDHMQKETPEGFTNSANMDVQDIVARRLTIIGEAAAKLMKKHVGFCDQHPEIPLRQARGMRNVLVHEYDLVDWEAVWDTSQENLPQLMAAIEPYINFEANQDITEGDDFDPRP